MLKNTPQQKNLRGGGGGDYRHCPNNKISKNNWHVTKILTHKKNNGGQNFNHVI